MMPSMAAKKKRTSGPSGKHKARTLVLDEGREGQFDEWTEEAKRRGQSRAEWIRSTVDAALARKK